MTTTNDELKSLISKVPEATRELLRPEMEAIADSSAEKAIQKHFEFCKAQREKDSTEIRIPKKSIAGWIKIVVAAVGLIASGAGVSEFFKLFQ